MLEVGTKHVRWLAFHQRKLQIQFNTLFSKVYTNHLETCIIGNKSCDEFQIRTVEMFLVFSNHPERKNYNLKHTYLWLLAFEQIPHDTSPRTCTNLIFGLLSVGCCSFEHGIFKFVERLIMVTPKRLPKYAHQILSKSVSFFSVAVTFK